MGTGAGVVLRSIVTEFLSANIVLATEEQSAYLSKFDPEPKSETLSEIGRILHDMLLAEEQSVVRWERRRQPFFQWSPWAGRNKQPDFAWLADRLKARFERTTPRCMAVIRPSKTLEGIRKLPFPPFDVGSEEEQVFRNLAITDAFLAWDEADLRDDDGLDWILLPSNEHRQFADCPVHHPDVAIDSVFGETTAAIIIGNGQSQEQLREMHRFLADREIAYQYW